MVCIYHGPTMIFTCLTMQWLKSHLFLSATNWLLNYPNTIRVDPTELPNKRYSKKKSRASFVIALAFYRSHPLFTKNLKRIRYSASVKYFARGPISPPLYSINGNYLFPRCFDPETLLLLLIAGHGNLDDATDVVGRILKVIQDGRLRPNEKFEKFEKKNISRTQQEWNDHNPLLIPHIGLY